jgi:predicted amidophosphoribosyltransferase
MAIETSLYTTVAVFITILIMMSSMIIIARISKGKQKTLAEEQNKNCSNCGREIPFDAVVCPYCKYDFK